MNGQMSKHGSTAFMEKENKIRTVQSLKKVKLLEGFCRDEVQFLVALRISQL